MSHIYYSVVVNKEELNPDEFTMWKSDDLEFLVPIVHIESDNKEEIREEMIKSIDSMLKKI